MLIAVPQLAILVVGSHDNVTILGQTKRRSIWQVKLGVIVRCEADRLPQALIIIGLAAQFRHFGVGADREILQAATQCVILDSVVVRD